MHDSDRPERTSYLNWSSLFFLVALAFGAAVWLLDISQYKPSAQQQYYSAECDKADERYRVLIDDTLPASLNAKEDTDAGQREEKAREQVAHWCDLVAQQSSAEATVFAAKQSLWVTVFTGAMFILTGVGVWLLYDTLRATSRAVDEAEKATQAILTEQRPWLKIVGFCQNKDIPSIYDISIENLGKSPAEEVEVRLRCVVKPDPEKPYEERIAQLQAFGQLRKEFTILPGEVGRFVYDEQVHCSYEDYDWFQAAAHFEIFITCMGSGCAKKAITFGIWRNHDCENYQEEQEARKYT